MKVKGYIIAILLLTLIGCKKKDEAPPVFQVNGDSLVTISLHSSYIDSGVVVKDDKSGFFMDTVTNFDNDNIGEYYYKYVAVDEEGNIGIFAREIKVILTLDNMVGQYNAIETVTEGPNTGTYGPYPIIITKNSSNSALLISNFGGWGTNVSANIIINEIGEMSIPQQAFNEGTLSGTGAINRNGKSFNVNYTYSYADGTDVSSFSATYQEE